MVRRTQETNITEKLSMNQDIQWTALPSPITRIVSFNLTNQSYNLLSTREDTNLTSSPSPGRCSWWSWRLSRPRPESWTWGRSWQWQWWTCPLYSKGRASAGEWPLADWRGSCRCGWRWWRAPPCPGGRQTRSTDISSQSRASAWRPWYWSCPPSSWCCPPCPRPAGSCRK